MEEWKRGRLEEWSIGVIEKWNGEDTEVLE
jgi:hypothetical protein